MLHNLKMFGLVLTAMLVLSTQIASAGVSPDAQSTSAPLGVTTILPSNTAVAFPANASLATSEMVSGMQIAALIGLNRPDNVLSMQSATLKAFKDAAIAKSAAIHFVDPQRVVYEVVTTFNTTYRIRGNVWTSGVRTFIVDAATGKVLISSTKGTQIENEAESHNKDFQSHSNELTRPTAK